MRLAVPMAAISGLLAALGGAGPAAGFEYEQTPALLGTLGGSYDDGFIVADDIPAEYAGETISEVTLYVAFWGTSWQEPDGLTLRFFEGTCPPPAPTPPEIFIDWDDVASTVYGSGGIFGVFEVTFSLPQPVPITSTTSLGASVNYPWAPAPPYLGFTVANPETPAGCGELYWYDNGWTPGSSLLGGPADMAYVLRGPDATSAPQWESDSWSRVKVRYR